MAFEFEISLSCAVSYRPTNNRKWDCPQFRRTTPQSDRTLRFHATMDAQLFGIVGTALSAAIAAVSYFVKTSRERRRSTRTVLFYLLEIHHLLARSQFGLKLFPEEYIALCRSALLARSVRMSDAEASALSAVIEALIRQVTNSELDDLQLSIAKPFEAALNELARDDPILAFELRGKDSIAQVSKMIGALQSSVEQAPTHIQPGDPNTELCIRGVDDLSRQLALGELKRCVRLTARKCGPMTYLKVRWHLRNSGRVRSMDDVHSEISEAITSLLSQIPIQGSPPRASESHKQHEAI